MNSSSCRKSAPLGSFASQTKLIHSVVATAANAADSTMLLHLLHGEETRVWGDQAYRGQGEVLREHAPHAQDFTHQRYRYKDRIDEIEQEKNRTKSKVRSKVDGDTFRYRSKKSNLRSVSGKNVTAKQSEIDRTWKEVQALAVRYGA
jgi:IS5 family transposase